MAVADVELASAESGKETRAVTVASKASPSASPATATTVLLATVWVALISGAAEGLYWLVRQQLGGELVFMHPGYLWMGPLVQLIVLLPIGGAVAVVAWHTRSPGSAAFAVTLLSLIGWLNLLELFIPGLHFWAWVLLAGGLATATGRLYVRYPRACLTVMRCTTFGMLAVFLVAALMQGALAWRRESSAVAALPESRPDAPNVLLIVLDTLRADALEAPDGGETAMPNLARLAGQGVVFESAWSTGPWTLPSQAGMFTGRLPHELSTDWRTRLDDAHPTLAEELASRGWATCGMVANTRYCSVETGLARGFTHYEDYGWSWADFVMCTALGRKFLMSEAAVRVGLCDWPGRKRAADINAALLSWLDSRERRRPYFAFVNYWDAHDPYFAPPDFQDPDTLDLQDRMLLRQWWWVHKEGLSPHQLDMQQDAYWDCVRGLDHQLGELFRRLEDRGELENTLVIITADHGEHFGEHGLYLHGNSLYEPLLHVPLIVIWPGEVPAGRRVQTPVSLRGLPRTVMELVGRESEFPGESWAPHFAEGTSDASRPQPLFAEIGSQAGYPPCHGRSPVAAGSMQCVRLGDMKYIRGGNGYEELFDLARDPLETENLAYEPAYESVLLRLKNSLPAAKNSQFD